MRPLGLLFALALGACGASSATCDVGRVQRHEAALARAAASASQEAAPCSAHETICSEADRICAISASCEDSDLKTRCQRATASCERLQNCDTTSRVQP